MTSVPGNAFSAFLNILIEPRAALAAVLQNKKSFWAPMLVAIVTAQLFWLWYYMTVDFGWLTEYLLDISNPAATEAQRKAMAALVTFKVQLWSTLIGVVVILVLTYVLQAAYLLVVSKVQDDDDTSFGEWFNLTAWAYFPKVLITLLAALSYAAARNGQIGPSDLNPASLNALLFHFPGTHPWAGLTNSLDITVPWTIVLLAIGFSLRKRVSLGRAGLIAAAPYLLIYGVWAGVKFTSGV